MFISRVQQQISPSLPYHILTIYLVYQVSDKRLLKWCGTGKGFLAEARSGSVRPSGLRITRAEALANELRFRIPGRSMKPETFFQRFSHRAAGENELRHAIFCNWSRSSGKWRQQPEGRFVPEVRSQDRTKGQQEGKAVTGITGSPRVENPGLASGNSAGQNNSNLTPYAASVANGEWELLLGIVPITVLYNPLFSIPACLQPLLNFQLPLICVF
jgi:hypothetical protein